MSWFKKQPKVEFLCTADVALIQYPIIEARKFMPEWFTQATTEHAKDMLLLKQSNDVNAIRDVSKCNGIRKLLKTGWVVRAYQDIHLQIVGTQFIWTTPLDQVQLNNIPLVEHHSTDSFKKCPHLENKTPILKIQLPWLVKIPKGYNMMQLPLAYWNETRFTTATGIFDRQFGFMQINVQLLWEGGDGEFLIKAGTPLAHLILVPEINVSHTVRLVTEKEARQQQNIVDIKSCSYHQNYAVIKNNIKQVFKRGIK